jgi:hypothetical protein
MSKRHFLMVERTLVRLNVSSQLNTLIINDLYAFYEQNLVRQA